MSNIKHMKVADNLNPLRSEIHRIIYAVNRCLIDQGYGEKRSQVRKRNLIDLRGTFQSGNLAQLMAEADSRLKEANPTLSRSWLISLPPFEHGTIQWIDDEYITWDMKDLDLDKRTYGYTLHYYYQEEDVWHIGHEISVEAEIVDKDNDIGYATSVEYLVSSFTEEAKTLTLSDIKAYTEGYADDKTVSRLIPVPEMMMYMPKETEQEAEDFMAQKLELILHMFKHINTILSLNNNRTQKPRKTSGKVKASYQPSALSGEDKRTEHVINGITILSEVKPKAHTMESIRRYKCATWSVRAHQRTYKNGKVVYIKEQQRQRHNMNATKPNARKMIFT